MADLRKTPGPSTEPKGSHRPDGLGVSAFTENVSPETGSGGTDGLAAPAKPWATPQGRAELFRLAYRLLWNEAEAEDAVQDALLTAEDRGRQIADPAKAWPWVCRVVVQQCRLTRRVRQRRRRGWLRWIVHDGIRAAGVEAIHEDDEVKSMFRALLPRLPRRQGEVLVLRHLQGWSFEQIGEVLEISAGTARVQAMNARETLLKLMRENYPEIVDAQRDRIGTESEETR